MTVIDACYPDPVFYLFMKLMLYILNLYLGDLYIYVFFCVINYYLQVS